MARGSPRRVSMGNFDSTAVGFNHIICCRDHANQAPPDRERESEFRRERDREECLVLFISYYLQKAPP